MYHFEQLASYIYWTLTQRNSQTVYINGLIYIGWLASIQVFSVTAFFLMLYNSRSSSIKGHFFLILAELSIYCRSE